MTLYANTSFIDNLETIVTLKPLTAVPSFDPSNPPAMAYAVPDGTALGWVKQWTTEPTYDPDTGDLLTPGEYEFVAPGPPSFDQTEERYADAVQAMLDRFAQTRYYQDILHAVSYANSTDAGFQSDGQYCLTARDKTWETYNSIMAQVEAGTIPMPDFDDFMAQMPPLAWPE